MLGQYCRRGVVSGNCQLASWWPPLLSASCFPAGFVVTCICMLALEAFVESVVFEARPPSRICAPCALEPCCCTAITFGVGWAVIAHYFWCIVSVSQGPPAHPSLGQSLQTSATITIFGASSLPLQSGMHIILLLCVDIEALLTRQTGSRFAIGSWVLRGLASVRGGCTICVHVASSLLQNTL